MQTIEHSDIDALLKELPVNGNKRFADALQSIQTDDDLLRLLGRYVYFNATFGGGVASLAGQIAVRQDLFRDANDPIPALADRSMDVASDIFAAAVDEFDDSATPYRDTHRSLATATLIAAGQFFGRDKDALNILFTPDAETLEAVKAAQNGYGVRQSLDAPGLFRAIGFHIGSEILADEEFHLLDDCLRTRNPELVAHLETARVPINGEEHAAYFWIHIHTSVEADHFAYAVAGANRALRYYTGDDADQAKEAILNGIRDFADVQARFMAHLGTSTAWTGTSRSARATDGAAA